MLPLAELQKIFVHGLNSKSNDILDWIRSSTDLSAQEHFSIYKSSIKGALQNNLKEIYPVCNKLVGDDFFISMINEYIVHTKSYSPNITDYGSDLALFIANLEPAKLLPYLADIARLEWAWHVIFSAAPSKGIDFAKLAKCFVSKSERIIFSLPPASTLIASNYPIHLIWQANQDEEEQDKDQIIHLPANAHFYYLVWRKELVMRIDLLSVAEWQILTWIKDNMTWVEVCRLVSDNSSMINLEEILIKGVSNGWIGEFKIGDPPCQ